MDLITEAYCRKASELQSLLRGNPHLRDGDPAPLIDIRVTGANGEDAYKLARNPAGDYVVYGLLRLENTVLQVTTMVSGTACERIDKELVRRQVLSILAGQIANMLMDRS